MVIDTLLMQEILQQFILFVVRYIRAGAGFQQWTDNICTIYRYDLIKVLSTIAPDILSEVIHTSIHHTFGVGSKLGT